MRISKILRRIRAGKPARLAMLGHFLPPFVAYAASMGYDGIWLDLEHRTWDNREIQALLAFFHLYDIDCLLRPATRDKASLYRYLEDGATGLVVPHVSTANEARDLVRKVKFPPIGDRGINGIGLEANFGVDIDEGLDSLIDHALRETFLIVQCETPEALANLEDIAAVEGVDGFFVGPADLAARMAHEPKERQVRYERALDNLAAVCRSYNRCWGTLAKSSGDLKNLRKQGAQLLVWGVDTSIMRDGLSLSSKDLIAAMRD